VLEELSFEQGLKRARASKKVMLYSSGTRAAIDRRRSYFCTYGSEAYLPERYRELVKAADKRKAIDRRERDLEFVKRNLIHYI